MKNAYSKMSFGNYSLISLFFITFLIAGCDKDPCGDVTCENGGICVDGDCDCPTGFTGQFCQNVVPPPVRQVRTWADIDAQGNPIALGVSIPEEMLLNLPPLPERLSIKLPSTASSTLFDHVYYGWESHGHEPFWHAPHFDFHFMMVSETVRESVPVGTETSPLPNDYKPQDYATTGLVVPLMGVHWWDQTSPELNGGDFTSTMIYGSYQGQITFIEPMVSLAYLQTRPTMTFNIKQPLKYQKTGYWPTTYTVAYDTVASEFDISIGGFILRTAS